MYQDCTRFQIKVKFFFFLRRKSQPLIIFSRRDRLAFSKNLLKKFIKEYTVKDSYIGAPWIIRQDTADRFGIDTTLPKELQLARDIAYSKSRKKRSEANGTSNPDGLEDKRNLSDAKRIESTLKYPMEDLNVPIYRRDPSGSGPILDMTPGTEGHEKLAPNPTGGMPLRPQPNRESSIPKDAYGPFLMVWSFLGVFSHPLKLSPFSLDDFENALRHHSPTTILIESNIALLNAIITQRDRLKKESLGHGSTALQAMTSLYGSGYQSCRSQPHPFQQDDEEEDVLTRTRVQPRKSTTERGCGSAPVEAISLNWDHGTVDTYDERLGWEDILIGFINQLAPLEMLDDVDRILSQLVPHVGSTLDQREQAYVDLSLRDKVKVFELLLSVANESHVIK